MEHRNSHPREMRRSERVWAYAALLVMLVLVLAAPLGLAMAQEAPAGAAVEYRDVPGIGSRNLIWIVAQQHLLLAGFVLGVPIFVSEDGGATSKPTATESPPADGTSSHRKRTRLWWPSTSPPCSLNTWPGACS